MKFESELKKGILMIGTCPKCKKTTWPPSDFCNVCFGNLEWKESSYEGKLIEFTKKNNENFCLAEIDNEIRLMGTLIGNSEIPHHGSKIRLQKCGIRNGNYFFIFVQI